MTIAPLTFPTRSNKHATVQADVTALVAKANELAVAVGLPNLRIPGRRGTGTGVSAYLADINALIMKVDEISDRLGISKLNIGPRRLTDGSAQAEDANVLAARLNTLITVLGAPRTAFAMLAPNFDKTLLPFTASSAGVTIGSGRARIAVDLGYQYLMTPNRYTLLGSSVHAVLRPPGRGGASSDANLGMSVNSPTAGTSATILINRANDTISFLNNAGYYDPSAVRLRYDSVAHGWARLREHDGTLYWDTSADGTKWINRRSTATPPWLTGTPNQNLQFTTHRNGGIIDHAEVGSINADGIVGSGRPNNPLVTRALFGLAGSAAAGTEAAYQARQRLLGCVPRLYGMFVNWNDDLTSATARSIRRARAAEGATLVCAWMPQRAYGGNVSMQTGRVLFTDILAGVYDDYISTVLTELGNYPGQVLIRFAHEMNLPSSEYSPGRPNGPLKGCFSTGDFIGVWKYIVQKQRTLGKRNIKWLYCPNGTDGNAAATIESCWPSASYVDWTGFDTYRMLENLNVSFDTLVGKAYNRVTALPGASALPVAIGEIGADDKSSAYTKSQWIQQMFNSTSFPGLRAVTYFDQDAWAIDSNSSSSLSAFRVGFQANRG